MAFVTPCSSAAWRIADRLVASPPDDVDDTDSVRRKDACRLRDRCSGVTHSETLRDGMRLGGGARRLLMVRARGFPGSRLGWGSATVGPSSERCGCCRLCCISNSKLGPRRGSSERCLRMSGMGGEGSKVEGECIKSSWC